MKTIRLSRTNKNIYLKYLLLSFMYAKKYAAQHTAQHKQHTILNEPTNLIFLFLL